MQLCRPLAVADAPNITIIGAGLIGLCTAEALSARGARVTVLDAQPGPCEGTSFSNSGMIHPSQALSWAETIVDAAAGAAQAAQTLFNQIGVRANILIDQIDTFGQAACQFPEDSSGDSRAFGCALAADLARRGVAFIYSASDIEFRPTQTGFGVRTGGRIIKADHLILAAGIKTAQLLATVEIRMQLEAVSGTAADFSRPVEAGDLPAYPVMDTQSRSALTVFEDRVRISGGWGLTDPASLIERWRDLAPGLMLRLGEPLSTWTGVRPVSPVGRPYISATSKPGLWVNTGHGHMGWTQRGPVWIFWLGHPLA